MTRSPLMLSLSLAALAVPSSGFAMQADPARQPPQPATMPASACTPDHAAMGHCTMPTANPAPTPHTADSMAGHSPTGASHAHAGHEQHQAAPAASPKPASQACTPEHAAMGHCIMQPAHGQENQHTGQQAGQHDGHAMHGGASPDAPPVLAPPPEAFSGPEHPASLIYDPGRFAQSREAMLREHGGAAASMILVDRLEYRHSEGEDAYKVAIQGWYGGDYDRFWLKVDGEGAFGGSVEQVEVQALYSRALDPWFNLQAGVRHDFRSGPERTHFVLGLHGLAPYWFEVGGALFLSNKGELTARIEAEYDQRITQKLILQPAAELELSAQNMPELGIGAGVSSVSAGARLRYEFVPEFAPYVGAEYERALGDTADYRRAAGEKAGRWTILAGIRMWF